MNLIIYVNRCLIYIFFYFDRCSWFERCPNHWTNARKVTMCIGRILSIPISKSANTFWQTTSEITVTENSVFISDWAVVFCSTSWQDSDRNLNPRHDYVWSIISMAIHLITNNIFCDISDTLSTSTTHLCTYVVATKPHLLIFWKQYFRLF